jgi:hypothetical protein
MSGLDVISVQDTITEYIKDEFSAYVVYEDGVLDDEHLLQLNNKIKPYIVVSHGMPSRNAAATSFGGVRLDEYTCTVDVSIVAPTGKQVRLALNIINDYLVGWKPTGGGALTPFASGGPWAVLNDSGAAHVYTGSIRFEYAINSENPGEYITP